MVFHLRWRHLHCRCQKTDEASPTFFFLLFAGAVFHNLPFWESTSVHWTERLGRDLICLGNLKGLREVCLLLFHHLSPLEQSNLRGMQLHCLYHGDPIVARAWAQCRLLVLFHQCHICFSSLVIGEGDLK